MESWSTPMQFFFHGLVLCWTIQIVVYWILRNVMGISLWFGKDI